MKKRVVLIWGLLWGLASCSPLRVDENEGRVQWRGEQKRVIRSGDLTETADLNELSRLSHFYALGPVSRLQGEITVIEGRCFIADVVDRREVVTEDCSRKAPFLVYGSFPRFKTLSLSGSAVTTESLNERVESLARESGLDVEKPFIFLLEGPVEKIDYHIIKKKGDGPHNPQEHQKSRQHFTLSRTPVKLVGFFSKHHEGVFTPPGETSHIHFVSDDGLHSGHVESFEFSPESSITLKIQERN